MALIQTPTTESTPSQPLPRRRASGAPSRAVTSPTDLRGLQRYRTRLSQPKLRRSAPRRSK